MQKLQTKQKKQCVWAKHKKETKKHALWIVHNMLLTKYESFIEIIGIHIYIANQIHKIEKTEQSYKQSKSKKYKKVHSTLIYIRVAQKLQHETF